MSETVIRELSDGEELVVERAVTPYTRCYDDPRDRALETRRMAFDQPSRSESSQW